MRAMTDTVNRRDGWTLTGNRIKGGGALSQTGQFQRRRCEAKSRIQLAE
jgi:hypothetical protein